MRDIKSGASLCLQDRKRTNRKLLMGLNRQFRCEWKAPGYPTGNGSAVAVRPPRKGLKRLYYLTSPEQAISNIVFKRIKVSRFSELNDPFELLGAILLIGNFNKLFAPTRMTSTSNTGSFASVKIGPIPSSGAITLLSIAGSRLVSMSTLLLRSRSLINRHDLRKNFQEGRRPLRVLWPNYSFTRNMKVGAMSESGAF